MPLWEMEAPLCSGWDHLCRRTVHFLIKAECLYVLPLYFVFTFKVALVHLPVFTKCYIWDAFSIIKYYHLWKKKKVTLAI